ncbi:MAG: DUF3052 domain-containing protein [Myxococcota bacterium]
MPKTPMTHGYSKKTLAQKMGLKPGYRCLTMGAPNHYASLVGDAEDVAFGTRFRTADVVHWFCRRRADLDRDVERALQKVGESGMLWISWPKKSSEQFIDLVEDDLRTVLLPRGWVDVKVCAVDADWSGLKFMRRRS